ncbi:mortality factor 4-like protein 1 isoform X1 [Varroa jacobsoni]|uniref:mortality factor 4-like protein 1 isoform X1 n=2 Tax=Varroa jacobsoni TaxID=62625 RepID=UPI000BF4CF93|nr:mortality factor 4-like protein 1 isoform X1 [Varroa jacobsoni]
MAPAPKFKFQENEKVLCFHGPLLYEAKCIKAQVKDKVNKYFVHYSGWNTKWDEWVPESRMLKVNDANLAKQADLQAAQLKARKESGKRKSSIGGAATRDERRDSATPTGKEKDSAIGRGKDSADKKERPSTTGSRKRDSTSAAREKGSSLGATSSEEPKKKKTKIDAHVETEEHYMQKVEIRIKIPDDLKNRLADDWDLVCRQRKLVKLPCEYTVDKILQEYLTQKISVKGTTSSKESAITELTGGIRDYFNSMLGKHLLYKFERPQYAQVLEEHGLDAKMSEIYGAVHLLRMFSLLGRFLAYTALDEKAVQLLLSHLHDFLRYICRNAQYCNMCEYAVALPDYHRRAM